MIEQHPSCSIYVPQHSVTQAWGLIWMAERKQDLLSPTELLKQQVIIYWQITPHSREV